MMMRGFTFPLLLLSIDGHLTMDMGSKRASSPYRIISRIAFMIGFRGDFCQHICRTVTRPFLSILMI